MSKMFILDSFNGGISDYENKGIKGSFKFGSALDIRKKVDSLTCQQTLTSEGAGVFLDLLYFIVPSSDGNAYGFGDGGCVYKRTSGGTWTKVYEDDSEISGASEWYSDAGKTYLYWATSTKLHRKELPGLSNWSDVDADSGWPKTDLTSIGWHTMKPANGSLMICNAQYLAMVGYDSSYTNEALDLIKGNVARTLIERDGYVVVGTENLTNDPSIKGYLYIWDQSALSWLKKKLIPAKGINSLIDTELNLMQAGDKGKIYYSDLVNVIPVATFPGGGKIDPDGTDIDDGLALFGVYSNGTGYKGVYSYGRKDKNSPFTLNFDYPVTCDEIGSVKKVGTNILISYYSGTTYGVKKVDTANKATAVYESLDLKSPVEPNKPHLWEAIHIITTPMVSGTSVGIKYKLDKSGNWTSAYLQDGTTSFDDVGETEAYFQVGANAKIFEVQATLTPTGNTSPEILAINVMFT